MESLMAEQQILKVNVANDNNMLRDGEDKRGVGIPRPQKSFSKRKLLESNKG
jgi:hypothetical protein